MTSSFTPQSSTSWINSSISYRKTILSVSPKRYVSILLHSPAISNKSQTAKKLVEGDYKNGRVTDPTTISDKHKKTVKSYCKSFFEKAAAKHKEREARKGQKQATTISTATDPKPDSTPADDPDVKMSDDEADPVTHPHPDPDVSAEPPTPMDEDSTTSTLKRKRDGNATSPGVDTHITSEVDSSPSKRQRSTPPPPPPPPPPMDGPADADDPDTSVSPPSASEPKAKDFPGERGTDIEMSDIQPRPAVLSVQGNV
jgi:histone-lysine N-methyltransferase SETD2